MPRHSRFRRAESRERHVAEQELCCVAEYDTVLAHFVSPEWVSRHERDRRSEDREENEELRLRRKLLAQADIRHPEREEKEDEKLRKREEEEEKEEAFEAAAERWINQMKGCC